MQQALVLPSIHPFWMPQIYQSGVSPNKPTRYSSGAGASSSLVLGVNTTGLRAASYLYTGMGATESNVDFAADGPFIYSPSITSEGIGYATSRDSGETWTQVLPGGSAQPRPKSIVRKRASDDRYFYWSNQ
jgi:hypothetical protein